MDDLLTISLEAHNEERNHHRWYCVSAGRDLLRDWCVEIEYGRCGHRGQRRQFAGADRDEMCTVVRDHLRRRLSAPKRIGCTYRLTTLQVPPGFDLSSWLPADLLVGFVSESAAK